MPKEDHPGTSDLIDREAELEKTKCDVAELTDRVQAEQQLAEKTSAAEDAES